MQREITVGGLLTLFGLGGGTVVTVLTVTSLPGWLHATLLFGGVAAMALSAGALITLFVTHQRGPSTRRDVGAAEAITYIATRVWGASIYEAVTASHDVVAAQKALEQAARDGSLNVWGLLRQNGPYEPIPSEFWTDNQIEWFSLLKGEPSTASLRQSDNSAKYALLMTNRGDVQRLWPKKRRRLTIRLE